MKYIYNNLLYEDKMFPTNTSLRGISLAFKTKTTSSISKILIANNTIIGMPTHGMSLKFNDLQGDNIRNVMIVNNLIHNCYTNSGGQAINIINQSNYLFSSFPSEDFFSKMKEKSFNTGTLAIGDFFVTKTGHSLDISDVIIDYNIISAGNNGSDLIGFCVTLYPLKNFKMSLV